MEVSFSGVDMLTIGGVALAASVIVQLFWRNTLALFFDGAGSASDIDDRVRKASYGLALNGLAFVTALALALIAQALFVAVDYASIFEGFLVALGGTAGAVGVGEVVPTASRALKIT